MGGEAASIGQPGQVVGPDRGQDVALDAGHEVHHRAHREPACGELLDEVHHVEIAGRVTGRRQQDGRFASMLGPVVGQVAEVLPHRGLILDHGQVRIVERGQPGSHGPELRLPRCLQGGDGRQWLALRPG